MKFYNLGHSSTDWLIIPSECVLGFFFDIQGHVALDRNLGQEYNTLLLQLIKRYLYSACPYSQFQACVNPWPTPWDGPVTT